MSAPVLASGMVSGLHIACRVLRIAYCVLPRAFGRVRDSLLTIFELTESTLKTSVVRDEGDAIPLRGSADETEQQRGCAL